MKLQDLKRGMRCTNRRGRVYIVDEVDGKYIKYLTCDIEFYAGVDNMNEDLTNEAYVCDIMKVEDITLDGYKTIWEREEEKYYLKIPNYWLDNGGYLVVGKVNREYKIGNDTETEFRQTKFTKEEIYNLPKQKFIQGLEKVEVK